MVEVVNAPWLEFDRYPDFSDEEVASRRARMAEVMDRADLKHLVVYGWQRPGSAVQWLTGWPVTREAVVLLSSGERDVLFVQLFNHVPNAREIAHRSDVRWGGESTIQSVLDELHRRNAATGEVGFVGPLPARFYHELSKSFGYLQDVTFDYGSLRLVASPEEVEWFRVGAEMSDRAIDAIREHAQPGMTEFQLADLVERAYTSSGGLNHIHFFGITSMDRPERCVPAQHPSARKIRPGDILVTEISATYWGYPGQILRTFTVASDPSPLYVELFDVAEEIFDRILPRLKPGMDPRDLLDIASDIDAAGFSIYDDLVHCFGGGGEYRAVLARRSLGSWEVGDFPLAENMTVVVQPNIITRDETAGVQTGELVLITPDGAVRLHRSERGLVRIGDRNADAHR